MGAPIDPRRTFWRDARAIHGSVSPIVMPRVLVFGAIGALVMLLQGYLGGYTLEVGPVEVAGGALVLLLVLRTNAGYDRWWEGRKLWGGIVNQSRNLAVSSLAFAPTAEPAWRARLVHWTAAFSHAARRSLRGERDLPELRRLLGDAAADRLAVSGHPPSVVAFELASILRAATDAGWLSPFAFLQCDRERASLIDHVGACERILKTPLPLVYAIKVRRFVALYLIVLPFSLVDKVGWATPLLTMLVAYPILGLDQIAVELENPFSKSNLSHLPLDSICETIETNVLALLGPDVVPDDGRGAPERPPE